MLASENKQTNVTQIKQTVNKTDIIITLTKEC